MSRYELDDLLQLMVRLRTPRTGCPWDLAQDYASIAPSTIEEAYEVVDAIEREDFQHLVEELGDLLFQVIFYAQLGREDSRFEFKDIVHELTAKLIRRHPHVFPEGTLDSVRDLSPTGQSAEQKIAIAQRWEQIKASERVEKGSDGLLDDVPLALPALQRAQKLQKRVGKAGMDWRSTSACIDKLDEEIAELKQALRDEDASEVENELGDVMFSCVNVARHLKLDADTTLRRANNKFEARIRSMERYIEHDNCDWSSLSDEQLDEYWHKAKSTEH